MTIAEFLGELDALKKDGRPVPEHTVDSVKAGDPSRNLTRAAIAMFATPDVIREAADWGAELLIVHEPVFYNHEDVFDPKDALMAKKAELFRKAGLCVYRFHDHPHCMENDMIDVGTIQSSGLDGTVTGKPFWAVTEFRLNSPMTARELARTLEKNLGTEHIRIAGSMNSPGRNIAFACGTPGHLDEMLLGNEIDFIVTGEICEWASGERARDLSRLGGGKAMLVLGHCISERAGMRLLCDILRKKYKSPEFRYFECGGLYSYTD